MKKIRPYVEFVNEKFAPIFNKFGSDYIKRYKDTLLGFIDLGRTNSENVKQISYEDVQKKKYYDPKYVILACGNKQEYADNFDYNKPEGPDNPRYVSHYAILYIFQGTEVKVIEGYGKNGASRKKAIYSGYDYYAIDTTGMERNFDIRNKRWSIKNGAWLKDDVDSTGKLKDFKDRTGRNKYEREMNKQRYLEGKKKKLNVDNLFNKISEKISQYNKYFEIKCEYIRLKTKNNEIVNEQPIRNISNWPAVRGIANELSKNSIYLSNHEHMNNPIELLDELCINLNHIKQSNSSHSSDYGKIELINKAIDKITIPDTSELINEINKLKWLDSDKLTGLNKSIGIMDADEN